MQSVKLTAAKHISIIDTIQILISTNNQPETITIMLNNTEINPIREAILANLHIIIYFTTNLSLQPQPITEVVVIICTAEL
jgi:hypothetical protein